jgi:hypothetical protein
MSKQETNDSRYVVREFPQTELLPAIIDEANLTDAKIMNLEGALLTDRSLQPDQRAGLGLVVGRCGWNRSEGALRQLAHNLLQNGAETEAQIARLALTLLKPSPHLLERGDEGYHFHESGQPALYVEDRIAGHWHRRGRWGPPIRPVVGLPKRLLAFEEISRAVDAAMDGERILIEGTAESWIVTRAWLSTHSRLDEPIRWARVRSMGAVASVIGVSRLAFEVEGCPVQVLDVEDSRKDVCSAFLLEMYRRTREISRGA